MSAVEENPDEVSGKDPTDPSDIFKATSSEPSSADGTCPPCNITTSPSTHVDEVAVVNSEAGSQKEAIFVTISSPNTQPVNQVTDVHVTEPTSNSVEETDSHDGSSTEPGPCEGALEVSDTCVGSLKGSEMLDESLFDDTVPKSSEIDVVQKSPSSDSKLSLDFEDDKEYLLDDSKLDETEDCNTIDDPISHATRVSNQSDLLKGENVSGDKGTEDPPPFSPKLLKAVINCVPQTLPDHVVKHFKGDGLGSSDSRKRKLSKQSDSSKHLKLGDSNNYMKLRNASKDVELIESSVSVKLRNSHNQAKVNDSSEHGKLDDSSRQLKLRNSSKQVKLDDPSKCVELDDSCKQLKVDDSRKDMKPDDSNKQAKLCPASKSQKANDELSVLPAKELPLNLTSQENCMVDKSSELDTADKFYDIKRILLQATRASSGVNLHRFRQFSNIFLKNWRFSKQFSVSRGTNARGKQIIYNTLTKIVKDLYESRLIKVKGPEENVDVVRMLTEEVKQDNSKIFSQTPPTLTVLITTELFDKYFTGGAKVKEAQSVNAAASTGSKRGGGGKTVHLGRAANQWIRLKDELGMEKNEEVASILIHCYKAWISVACSKCRRHMEVGMEQKSGRSISNSETSVCIVSCDCGKSTSGGFMIECDVCHKWQHGFCVNIDKDNIPDSYSCSWCQKIRGKVELSSEQTKGEDSDDSVVSIDNTELCSTDDSEPEVIELD